MVENINLKKVRVIDETSPELLLKHLKLMNHISDSLDSENSTPQSIRYTESSRS